MESPPMVILMAEDNEHDIFATRRAWKQNNIANKLHIVNDGEQCLDYLYRRGAYSDPASSPRPGLLLLDLNMPRLDGIGVLKVIRSDKAFCHLPVVVLTTSREDEDVIAIHDLCISAYIVKPVGFANFSEAIRRINLFWQLVQRSPICQP